MKCYTRERIKNLFVGSIVFGLTACAGKNLYPDARMDTKVLTRGFVLPSHLDERNAGDRGFEYSSIATFENALIFGSTGNGLVSIYPELNRAKWKFFPKGGIQSEILVEKKTIFTQASDGFFYAIEAETGNVKWKTDLKVSFASKPSFYNGRIFVTTPHDTVFSLDAGTGKLIWTYKRRSNESTSIRLCSSPLAKGNDVFVGLSDGFLVNLNLEDGTIKWEKKLNFAKKFPDVDASPLFIENQIIVPSYDGELFALNPKDGTILWKNESLGGSRKSLFSSNGILYVPSTNRSVSAVQPSNGKVLWKFELDHGTPTEIIDTGEYIVFGSSYQFIYALHKSSGKLAYRFNLGDGAGVASNPFLHEVKGNKAIYFLSHAGNLYQFIVRDFKENKQNIDLYSKTF